MHREFRQEVQALRALAVLLVVLFHLWPEQITGGFVGVDVFFVISGFLITSHLWRELQDSGRIRLSAFYARRIRRLLPAASLVLFVALAGVLLVVPRTDWAVMLRDIAASAVYSVNWVLAVSSVDYFAAEDAVSPVQHYWSLSVEEQFYIVWPLLLTLAWSLRTRRAVLAVLTGVFAASLVYSIIGAYSFQSFAYFATPAHAWEFAAGGLLAFILPQKLPRDSPFLAAISWLGWLAIVASAFLFSGASPFPGWIAMLPVLGTILVITAGTPSTPWAPTRIVRSRPIQFTGDVSYSLYLWHWLPIVLLPVALDRWAGRDYLTVLEKLLILASCILLAWLTKAIVEDPVRKAAALRVPRRTFVTAATVTALVAAAALVPTIILDRTQGAEEARLDEAVDEALGADGSACVGALAVADAEACENVHRVSNVESVAYLSEDTEFEWIERRASDDPYFAEECTDTASGSPVCRYGPHDADVTIAVVGDSHAGHLLPAVLTATRERGWAVDVWKLAECTPAINSFPTDKPDSRPECQAWRETVFEDVAASDADVVLTSAFTARYSSRMTNTPSEITPIENGFLQGWQIWRDAGKAVLAVSDTPQWRENIPRCIAAAGATQDDPCVAERDAVIFDDPLLGAAKRADDPLIAAVDLTDVLCDESQCHAVIGGLVVARDTTHLSAAFAATLSPWIDAALEPLVARTK